MKLILTLFDWVFLIKYHPRVAEFYVWKSYTLIPEIIQDLRYDTCRSMTTDRTSEEISILAALPEGDFGAR